MFIIIFMLKQNSPSPFFASKQDFYLGSYVVKHCYHMKSFVALILLFKEDLM